MIIVDVVQSFLKGFSRSEEGVGGLAWLNFPLVMWSIGSSTDSLVEEVCVVSLESVILTEVGGIEMFDVGKDGIADL